MKYEKAIVKFNNGEGALLCNDCHIILERGFDFDDREHFCPMCMSGKCNTRFKKKDE